MLGQSTREVSNAILTGSPLQSIDPADHETRGIELELGQNGRKPSNRNPGDVLKHIGTVGGAPAATAERKRTLTVSDVAAVCL